MSSLRSLRKRCKRIVADLNLPQPLTFDRMIARITELTGRPLSVIPLQPRNAPHGIYGLWIRTKTRDYIFYVQTGSPVHEGHTVLHEIGHIIMQREDSRLCQNFPLDLLPDPAFRRIFGDSTPHVIERIAARGVCDTTEEHQAEMIACLLSEMTTKGTPAGADGELVAALGLRARANPALEIEAESTE